MRINLNVDLYRLHLYRLPKARFISYTKTYIYTVNQNLDLYRIPKPRLISHTKI
jgi:hypothetical protein